MDPRAERIFKAADFVKERLDGKVPVAGIVLGSGLGKLADKIENPIVIHYKDIPGFPVSTAIGHKGNFIAGELGGKFVIAMQGRLHGYEGNTAQEVAFPIWLMNRIGVKTLITTNAAGAINKDYRVGDFCIIADHINLTGRNPIAGADPDKEAFRFFSMMDAYSPRLRALAKEVAQQHHIAVQEGVYLGLLGPSFETPAEIRAFRALGADTVAMSVCEEVIAARHVGMEVLGISLCSNMACGIENASPNDTEVLEVARQKEHDFATLVCETIARL